MISIVIIKNQAEFDKVFVTNLASIPQDEIIQILPCATDYSVYNPIVINKSNIIIQGYGKVRPKLKYVGASATANTGILSFNGTFGNELENIHVMNLDLDGVDKTKTKVLGIYCSYVGKAATTGLSGGGYDSSTVGIGIVNKVGICIKDCIVQNNGSSVISLTNSSNNTITGNTVQNNSGTGIIINASSNNTIAGNTVQNNRIYAIYLDTSSNNTITGNTVQNNSGTGISLTNSSNNTITGNTVQNNSGHGIIINASDNNTITGNTSQNNSSNGIYLFSSSNNNNTVAGNIVQNNKLSIDSKSTGNIIMSNIILVSTDYHIKNNGTQSLILGNIMTGTGTGILNPTSNNSKTVDNKKI